MKFNYVHDATGQTFSTDFPDPPDVLGDWVRKFEAEGGRIEVRKIRTGETNFSTFEDGNNFPSDELRIPEGGSEGKAVIELIEMMAARMGYSRPN